jgi:hypothetical protein
MTTISNTFETALADGTTITTSNSNDGTAGTAFTYVNAQGTRQFDTGQALDTGTRSVLLGTSAAGTEIPYLMWRSTAWTTSNPTWFRGYFRFSSVAPGDVFNIIQFRNSSGTHTGDGVVLNTSGQLELVSAYSGRYTSTALAADTWHRIEVKVTSSTTTGHMELRVFSGANVHGLTPDQSIGSATDNWDIGDNTGTGGFAFGICDNSATANLSMWVDDVAISDTDWLGPTGTPPASNPAASVVDGLALITTTDGTAPFSIAQDSGTTTAPTELDDGTSSGVGKWLVAQHASDTLVYTITDDNTLDSDPISIDPLPAGTVSGPKVRVSGSYV